MILETVERLKAAQGNPFRSVGGALSLAAAQENPPQKLPAAFVYPSAAMGQPSNRVNSSSQQILTRFGVAFVLRGDNDPTGAGKTDAVEAHYTWLRAALIGWVPDPATGAAVEFSRGYLAGFEDGGVWWAEEFTVEQYHHSSN